jgi:hypothetical protein
MNELLAKIDIKVSLEGSDRASFNNCRVALKRNGRTILKNKTSKQGKVNFNNLPRSNYVLVTNCKNYRKKRVELDSVSKTTIVDIKLMASDRAYISGSIEKLIVNYPDNEGITLILSGEDGKEVATTRTAKGGFYYFGNLPLGKYVVTIEPEKELPTGFYFTKTVDLTKDPQENIDFYY